MSIGRRPLCNLPFADDIDLLEGSEEEVQQLTEKLEETAAGYGVEISSGKILVSAISEHMWEWENAGRSGPIQIP